MTPSLMLINFLTGLILKQHLPNPLHKPVVMLSHLLAPSSGCSLSKIHTLRRLGWWKPGPPALVVHHQTTASILSLLRYSPPQICKVENSSESAVMAPCLYLLACNPACKSSVTNCDSDSISQARIEDFGGAWWLVYHLRPRARKTPAIHHLPACSFRILFWSSSHHLQRPHLGQ